MPPLRSSASFVGAGFIPPSCCLPNDDCHPERSEGSCQTDANRCAGSFVVSLLRMTGRGMRQRCFPGGRHECRPYDPSFVGAGFIPPSCCLPNDDCHPERSEGSCQTDANRCAGSFVVSLLRMTGGEQPQPFPSYQSFCSTYPLRSPSGNQT